MQSNLGDKLEKHSREGELTYKLLKMYVRQTEVQKKRGFLRRFKEQWEAHTKNNETEHTKIR